MSKDAVITTRKRPLSVWVLTVLNVLIAILLIAASFKGEDWGFPRAQVAFWGLLGIGISISAHMAWFGSRLGRNLLLLLSTGYLGMLLFQNAWTIAFVSQLPDAERALTHAALLAAFAVVFLAANFFFLLGKRARTFYS